MPNIDKLGRVDLDIIEAFANCNMVANRAAEQSHYTPKSLRYHFCKIQKITGLDPRNFFDLHQLIAEINEWKGDAR